jgi:hypothetical protein
MCTQLLRELRLLASASDCDSTESHVAGKLDTKMSETANSLDGDQITPAQAGVAKSVVSRDPRAQKGSGIYGGEFVWNGSNPARLRDHDFRVSSIDRYSRCDCVLTIYDVSPSAGLARTVFAAKEANTDALTGFPSGHSTAQRVNATYDFMARNAGQFQTRVGPRNRGRIGMTNPAGFDANSNLTGPRLRHRAFHYAKHARFGDFDCSVCFLHLCASYCSSRWQICITKKQLGAIRQMR